MKFEPNNLTLKQRIRLLLTVARVLTLLPVELLVRPKKWSFKREGWTFIFTTERHAQGEVRKDFTLLASQSMVKIDKEPLYNVRVEKHV